MLTSRQLLQTRCGMGVSGGSELVALGSSGKVAAVQSPQKTPPQWRQWCRQTSSDHTAPQSAHVSRASSATQSGWLASIATGGGAAASSSCDASANGSGGIAAMALAPHSNTLVTEQPGEQWGLEEPSQVKSSAAKR